MKISAILPFLLILLFSCAQENKNVGCEKLYESKNLWALNDIPYTGICENHENGILEYYSDFYDKTKLVSYIFLLLTTLQTRAMILFLTALSTDILFLPSATFLR